MQVQSFQMQRAEALVQWRSYNALLKSQQDRSARDMRSIYNQLKSGRKVLDLFASLKMAGLNDHQQPRLAICPADEAACLFRKGYDGGGVFSGQRDGLRRPPVARSVSVGKEVYPDWPKTAQQGIVDQDLRSPAPIIPPRFRPAHDLAGFWLLWEVEQWTPQPPVDPMLLRRLTPNMFVVLAVWDLTSLERAVIAGRM